MKGYIVPRGCKLQNGEIERIINKTCPCDGAVQHMRCAYTYDACECPIIIRAMEE